MAGRPIHDGLDSLHIGLPGSVGTSVGVAHLDTEGNALIAKFTLGQAQHLLDKRLCVFFKKALYKERYLIYH